MITVWRICPAKLVRMAFSGEGAFLYGGRWNSAGVRVGYASGAQSLASLEMLVHLDDPGDLAALNFVIIPVTFPEDYVNEVSKLPRRWWMYPAPTATARIGDAWIESRTTPVLRVPSAVVRDEWNYLLNPAHPKFSKLRIGKAKRFAFDSRLSRTAN